MAATGTGTKSVLEEKVEDLARSIQELARSLDLNKEAGIDPAETQKLVSTLLQLKSMEELGLHEPDRETIEAIERMTAALKQAAAGRRKV
ncbi:hypothetical protein [Methylobacterium radiodurans]|uniref:hypothetical protein n=1 Tax=Methylobacterium radiodurans TaxID=2202828 RepID=UPI0013A53AB7|nr:hypothetical protein [Methylobacterium radiodurans]